MEEPSSPRAYDLEERTASFGEAVIDFAKTIPVNPITSRLIRSSFKTHIREGEAPAEPVRAGIWLGGSLALPGFETGSSQLVGAGTSIGANYCEADDAVSKKDFRHKIGICKKEARESKFYVRMIVRAVPKLREAAKPLWQEAKELHLIFAKIYRS